MAYKATFIGNQADARDKAQEVTFRGIRFDIGEAIPVPDSVGDKLKGNNHFKVTGSAGGKEVEVPAANQVSDPAIDPASNA